MPGFDPNSAASAGAGIFGLPFKERDSALLLLPVPWEATTSYGGGTSRGPAAIRRASAQLDLHDEGVLRPYEPGIFMLPESPLVRAWNRSARAAALAAMRASAPARRRAAARARANALGSRLNAWVRDRADDILARGKIPGIVGGDHSVPYGAYQAAAERCGKFGILHIDAHSDTRDAFEGLLWSHASIMRNALRDIPAVERLVQVGVRDFCEQEEAFLRGLGRRAASFSDRALARRRHAGTPWARTAAEIVSLLPKNVWISVDIDGLDPRYGPHTGTPVPGGLDFSEAERLFEEVARSGRRILGFDLVEVAPAPGGRDEWDANVAMRLLYKLAAWTFVSRGLRRAR